MPISRIEIPVPIAGTHTETPTPVASAVTLSDSDVPQVSPNFEELYEAQKLENTRLANLLTASRVSSSAAPKSVKPSITADRARAMVGALAWQKMTRDERLISVGVDPKSVTNEGLRKIFGRGNDGSIGQDLMKTSPSRYSALKEAALAVGVYGA